MTEALQRRFSFFVAGCLALLAFEVCEAESSPFQELRLVVPVGHSNLVTTVAYSNDGEWILSGSFDRTARLWNANTGQEILYVREPLEVAAVAFTPDGQHFATGGTDGIARLYETKSGHLLQMFRGHTSPIGTLAFSSDGDFLITGSGFNPAPPTPGFESTVRLWKTSTGQELRRFEGHSAAVTAVAFLPGNQSLISVSLDGTARIWSTLRDREEKALRADGKPIRALAVSRDGRMVLAGGGELTTRTSFDSSWSLWDLNSGLLVHHFSGRQHPISAIDFSPEGDTAISCGMDGILQSWNLQTAKEIRNFGDKQGANYNCSARFSPDGRNLISGGLDSVVHVWRSVDDGGFRVLGGHVANVNFAVTARSGRLVATALSDGTAMLWDTMSDKPIRRFERQNSPTTSIALSRDGRFLVTGNGNYFAHDGPVRENPINLWDVKTGSLVRKFPGHAEVVTSLDLSPDGRLVLSAGNDGAVQVWNVETGILLIDKNVSHEVGPNIGGPETAVFSPDGRTFAVGLRNNVALIFETKTGREIARFTEHSVGTNMIGASVNMGLKSLAFTPDGHSLFTAGDEGVTRKIDIKTGKLVQTFGPTPLQTTSISLSDDARTLLTGSGDGTVRLWSVETGNELRHFEGHSDRITAVGFLKNDVVTASQDGTARIWDGSSGRELVRLISFVGSNWTVVDQEGRFDAQDGGTGSGLYWLAADDPLHSLPLEIFMRDYYTPRLLVTAIGRGDRPTVRPITKLNRVQPNVRIESVESGHSLSEALVDVTVIGKSDPPQKNRKTMTGAYDLRLFRNGQLVGEYPEPQGGSAGPQDIGAWRKASEIRATLDGRTAAAHTFHVRLSSADHGKPVVFTAYAFNEDRVKSETARNDAFKVPVDIVRRTARAYVLTVGINDYHSTQHNLEFAVKDAQVMTEALRKIKDHEVVPITLLTDKAHDGVGAVNQATKANIRAVLEVLAGKADAQQELERLRAAGIDAKAIAKLDKVTPDDAVIITYSGHGYTEQTGGFYLLPARSWAGETITPASLPTFISTDELSEWLRDVDAGEMAMIIDACHSAATVDVPGFKPGPMGDRGLGQLAYDKGMRILAATQSDDVALEIRDLKEGLLTYALVEEGLTRDSAGKFPADPEGKGEVTLSAWLKYGEQRTPELYEDALLHKVKVKRRDSTIDPAFLPAFIAAQKKHAQTPALFDFQKLGESVTLDLF